MRLFYVQNKRYVVKHKIIIYIATKIIIMNCKEILFVIGATFFLLVLMEKWEIRDYLVIHSPHKLITKALMCDFCLTFHIAVIVSIFVYLFGMPFVFLPCVTAGIISLIYEKNNNK